MRFKKLDLNLLNALDTLIRTRNVSRAADAMFMTQSAMSNALARLRDYFSDPLLVSVGRRMELSPLAESLRDPVREIMVRIEMAIDTTPTFEPTSCTRQITIVLSDYSLYTVIPDFLRTLACNAPGMAINLKPQHTSPFLMLERGEADLLIAPDIICSPNHPSKPLLTERLCCIVDANSSHPRTRFSRRAFEAAGQVIMQPPISGESYGLRACREVGLALRTEVSTFSFPSMGDLVRGTERVAVIQERLARKLIAEGGGLRIVRPPVELPRLRQMLQWHHAREHDPAIAWLVEQLQQTAAD